MYKKLKDLPQAIRDALPATAQRIWLGAYNSAHIDHKDEKDVESTASAIAWAAVKGKYKKVNDAWVAKTEAEIDADFKASAPEDDPEAVTESLFAIRESASVISIKENDQIWEGLADDEFPMVILKKGWSLNGNYYSEQKLEQLDGLIDKRKKMFTDHLPEGQSKSSRPIQQWTATIKKHWVNKAEGRVEGIVIIHDGELAKKAKRVPEEVQASVDIFAKVKKGSAEGREGVIVEDIQAYASTDFVTYASAGGGILSNLVQDMGFQLSDKCPEGQVCDRVKGQIAEVLLREGVIIKPKGAESMFKQLWEDLKVIMKRSDEQNKWWRLTDALRSGMSQIATSAKLKTMDDKKVAWHELIDEFADEAKNLDHEVLLANGNTYEWSAINPSAQPGTTQVREGAVEIKDLTLAALQKDRPELIQEAIKAHGESTESKQKQEAEAARVKKLEEENAKLVREKLEDGIKVAIAEAKLPEYAMTESYKKELLGMKTVEDAKKSLDNTKALIEAAAKASGGTAAGPGASFHPPTEIAPSAELKPLVESVSDANVAQLFRSGR